MTDVPGVIEKIKRLLLLQLMKQNKIENKIITGGMIPKIESAIQTLESGVESILIANNLQKGTIIGVINDELSFNNYKRDNIEFVDANQNELIDKDNNVYLDFSSGIGVTNLVLIWKFTKQFIIN